MFSTQRDSQSKIVEGNLSVQQNLSYVTTPSRSIFGQTTSCDGATGVLGAQDYGRLEIEYETIDSRRVRPSGRGEVNMRERYEFAEIHNDASVTEAASYEVPANLFPERDEDYSYLKH